MSGRRGAGGAEPAGAGVGTYRTVLRHPVAARLLTAKLVSELGDFVGITALVLLAYAATRSPLGPALVLAARSLPAVLAAGLFGSWLDRPPRRTALITLHLAGAAILAIPAVAPGTGTAIGASALLGVTRAAFRGVEAATIAGAVDRDARLPLFGLAAVINQAAQAVGILSGATATLALGPRPALVADAVSFVLAALVLSSLPATERVGRPGRAPAAEGLRVIWRQPTLRWLALATAASAFASPLPEAIAPAVARASWLPSTMAAPALGGLLFTLFVARGRLLRRVANQVRLATATGLAIVVTGVAITLHAPEWVYVAGNAAVGAGLGWLVGAQTTFTLLTPPERMAQVEGTMVATIILAGGVGITLLGALAEATVPGVAYLVAGVALLLCGIATGRRLRATPGTG